MHRTALQPQRCRCDPVPHDPLLASIPSRHADLRRSRSQPSSRSASRCQLRAMPDVGAAIDSLVTSGAPAPLREVVQVYSSTDIPDACNIQQTQRAACHSMPECSAVRSMLGLRSPNRYERQRNASALPSIIAALMRRHAVRRSSRPSSRR